MTKRWHSAETDAAVEIVARFIAEAERRPPHVALDSLLTIAERMEREQGGRLTEFQIRTFAAFLLGAERLAADIVDPEIEPRWLTSEDADRYAAGHALVPPMVGGGLVLTRH